MGIKKRNRNNNKPDIEVDNREIQLQNCSIETKKLSELTHELGHGLADFKFDMYLLK